MEYGFLFLGMGIGVIIGMQYIPHQNKKGNKKVVDQMWQLIEKFGR
ncbi:hypothetical protein ACS3UN_02565 [Oscillospiraceae bacterium LTW-04]|nr:hypothetical protein RBH76_07895 [Oscillospiraceae bacterium MB24-C1]